MLTVHPKGQHRGPVYTNTDDEKLGRSSYLLNQNHCNVYSTHCKGSDEVSAISDFVRSVRYDRGFHVINSCVWRLSRDRGTLCDLG